MSLNDTPDQRALLGQEVDDQPMGPSMLDMMAQAPPPQAPVRAIQGQGSTPMSGGGLDPQMLMQLLSGPTETQRMGQALAGGVAFMRGQPNPVTTMLEEQRRESQGIVSMLSKLQEQRDLNESRQAQVKLAQERLQDSRDARKDGLQKTSLDIMDKIINNPNATPEALAIAQPQFAALVKARHGVDLPPSIVQRTLTQEQQNNVLRDLYRGMPPDLIVKNNPLVSAQELPAYAAMLQKPGVLEDLKLTTPDQLADQETQRSLRKYQLMDAQLPRELKGNPQFAAALEAMTAKIFPGTDYADLTKAERAKVYDAVHLQGNQEKEQTLRLQNDLREQVMMAGILARLRAQGVKPTNPSIVAKAVEPFKKGDELISLMDALKEDLKGIPEDALPSADTMLAQKWAQIKRNTVYAGNSALFNFQQRWAPITIGALDRGYFDEKGARAIKAFEKQLDAVDKLPTRKTMNMYLDTVKDMVSRKLQRDLDIAENTSSTPVEVLEAAKYILGPRMPKSPSVQPSPLKPLSVIKELLDQRPGSPTKGKRIRVEIGVGEALEPGLIEVK